MIEFGPRSELVQEVEDLTAAAARLRKSLGIFNDAFKAVADALAADPGAWELVEVLNDARARAKEAE